MKLFRYDKKSGRFEYRLSDRLNEIEIRTLFFIKNNGFINNQHENALFAEDASGQTRQDREDNVGQIFHDVGWHLSNLLLIKFEHDKVISDWDQNKKEYVNQRKVTGYFLTDIGKSFINSLEQNTKKK